jgi:hypothetical protein
MVAGVPATVFPHDPVISHGEDRRHRPCVTDLASDPMSLPERSDPARPRRRPEHREHTAPLYVEPAVQLAVRIGDRHRTGEQSIEEHRPLLDRSLVHEDDGRVIGPLGDGVGELVDELTVEQSTVVA